MSSANKRIKKRAAGVISENKELNKELQSLKKECKAAIDFQSSVGKILKKLNPKRNREATTTRKTIASILAPV